MTPFAVRKGGGRGLAVTSLGLGGAPLGNLFAPIVESEAQAVIRAAWDGGARYFDTAPHYGQGLSELRFRRALNAMPRADFLLSTKVAGIMTPHPGPPGRISNFVDGLHAHHH